VRRIEEYGADVLVRGLVVQIELAFCSRPGVLSTTSSDSVRGMGTDDLSVHIFWRHFIALVRCVGYVRHDSVPIRENRHTVRSARVKLAPHMRGITETDSCVAVVGDGDLSPVSFAHDER
jgi:hypothetical protein